jgi:hypothetical protein
MRPLLFSTCLIALSACTWVPLAPEAQAIRVVPAGTTPANCEKRGEVVVSVKHKVGFVQRNALKVRDELETQARNEAPSLQANTIQPLGEPANGEQRFAAFRCGL